MNNISASHSQAVRDAISAHAAEIDGLEAGCGLPVTLETIDRPNVRLELSCDFFREADGSLTRTWLVDGSVEALPVHQIPTMIGYLQQLRLAYLASNPGPGFGEHLVHADAESNTKRL